MSLSPAEVVKAILDVDSYANLNYQPSIAVIGIDRIDQITPGRVILLSDGDEDGEFTLNNVAINVYNYVEARIVMKNKADRENCFLDVKAIFEASDYPITYETEERENRMNLFIITLRIKIYI